MSIIWEKRADFDKFMGLNLVFKLWQNLKIKILNRVKVKRFSINLIESIDKNKEIIIFL